MSFPKKLTQIDDLLRKNHHLLTANDVCYFFGEYTARAGFGFSDTNQLIMNLKKPMDRREKPEWKYKTEAITKASQAITAVFSSLDCSKVTFIPIPPSDEVSSPNHDNRVYQILRKGLAEIRADIRQAITLTRARDPLHSTANTRNIKLLLDCHSLDEQLISDSNDEIVLFDDVITTGCSFRAHKELILNKYPNKTIIGVFLARRV